MNGPSPLRVAASVVLVRHVDPVTHILLGASLGYGVFGRKLGATAAWAGGLAAFAPDIDVFIRSASDPLVAIEHHRGFTHSFVFAPFGAGVVAALWLAGKNRRASWLVWPAALVGYVSHELLDAATSYGTRLFWPFSDYRAGWDLISIIDPIFTLVLLLGLIGSLVTRRRTGTVAALIFCAAYIGFGTVQHARAAAVQTELARRRGHAIERREVMPTLANNVVWRALYSHQGRVYSDRIRVGWFSGATVREGWSLPLVDAAQLTAEERNRDRRRSFERFAWFSERWVARSPAEPAVLGDMRYSLSAEAFDPIWGIRFTSLGNATEVEWVNRSRERKIEPRQLWAEIAGNDARFVALSPNPPAAGSQ